ncbi:MAG: MTH938/NDUFAF3 family protein [Pseudomonadota bacterium]
MQLTEHRSNELHVIHSLRPNYVRVGQQEYTQSILLTPVEGVEHWPVASIDEFAVDHLQPIFERKPEVVILASGRELKFPPRDIQLEFLKRGVGLEVMTLAAAARTFNVLASEDRRVLGAFIWQAR